MISETEKHLLNIEPSLEYKIGDHSYVNNPDYFSLIEIEIN